MPEVRSQWTINLVILFIGVITAACIGGAILLTAWKDPIPDQLWTVGTTGLGLLGGMLISTRGTPAAAVPDAPPAAAPGDETLA